MNLSELKTKFEQHVKELQQQIIQEMQRIDPHLTLTKDEWSREDHTGNHGGGGLTCALEGKVFENAGVNTSCVFGKIDPQFSVTLQGSGDEMWACGISLIIHPINPKVPTVHANFRLLHKGDQFWFGGGADLTPYYPHVEDFQYFHRVWKDAITPYGFYKAWKDECDRYFVNTHRGDEMRGVGGFFYDHFNSSDMEKDFHMVVDISSHFIQSYFPIVLKRMSESYNEQDEEFQLHRRGRYVEFNLLHDRGTIFGLKTKGRVDSILISLPKRAKYTYKYAPLKNSPHEKMMEYYYPKDWNDV